MPKFTLKQRLIGINLAASLAITAVGLIGLYATNSVTKGYKPIAEKNLPATRVLGDILFNFRQVRIEVLSIPLRGNSPEQIQKYRVAAKGAVIEVDKNLAEAEKLFAEEKEKQIFQNLVRGWQDFKAFGGEIFELAEKGDEVSLDQVAKSIRDVCPEKTKPVENNLNELIVLQSSVASSEAVDAEKNSRFLNQLVTVSLLLSVTILMLVSIRVATQLASQLLGSTSGVGSSSGSVAAAVNQVAAAAQDVMSAVELPAVLSRKFRQRFPAQRNARAKYKNLRKAPAASPKQGPKQWIAFPPP
jgi:methyl-accepting chemotaxis protein